MEKILQCERCQGYSFEPGYQVIMGPADAFKKLETRWPETLRCARCGLVYRRDTFGDLEKDPT
jgi:hypothetical protein